MNPSLWIWPFVGTMSLGVFLAAGVAARPGPRGARIPLAALLLTAGAFAGEFAAMFSGLYRPPVVFVTYPLFFLLGPAAWFCVRALDGTLPPAPKRWLHLLPALLVAIDLSPYYLDLLRTGGQPAHGGRTLLGLGGYAQCVTQLLHTTAYVVACRAPLLRIERRARDRHSGDAVDRIRWVRRIVGTLAAATGINALAMLVMRFAHHHVLFAEAAMGLSVAGLVVVLGWTILQRPGVLDAGPDPDPRPARPDADPAQLAGAADLIRRTVEDRRLWLQPDLTLAGLADAVHLPRHRVSEALNRGLGVSFFDFVNAYRVHEAARQLLAEGEAGKTMLAIAYDAGFASKASFNRVFKERVGMTPSEFRTRATPDALGQLLPLDVG